MIQSEKELLLQLLVEKYSKNQLKIAPIEPIVKTTRKYTKRIKHTRKNKDRIKWTPELKTSLIEWDRAGLSLDSFAESAGIRKSQAVSMLYEITKRNPIMTKSS